MKKQISLKILCILALAVLSQLLTGCSGLDHLKICNNYPFSVQILSDQHGLIGTVPAETMVVFNGKGGYKGSGLEGMKYEDAKGKVLGTFNEKSLNVKREDVSKFTGIATWTVTLGPAKPAGLFSGPFFSMLTSPGVILLLALAVFGVWKWKNSLPTRK